MANLAPDRFFDRISAIDAHADLLDRGLTCGLLDIDNTIRSRADRMVPPDVRAWLDGTRAAGVDLCLLSNNYHKNVPELAAELNLPYIYKALKPLHAESRNTVVIGDQLGTDILGARLLGLHAYLVAPLASQDARYALLFRKMEQRLIRRTKERSGAGNAEPEGAPAFARSERSREES